MKGFSASCKQNVEIFGKSGMYQPNTSGFDFSNVFSVVA